MKFRIVMDIEVSEGSLTQAINQHQDRYGEGIIPAEELIAQEIEMHMMNDEIVSVHDCTVWESKKLINFTWWMGENGWPIFNIDGMPYLGLISGRVYDRTVCRSASGSISITEEELFKED